MYLHQKCQLTICDPENIDFSTYIVFTCACVLLCSIDRNCTNLLQLFNFGFLRFKIAYLHLFNYLP